MLNRHYTDIHLRCTCEEAWGHALACAGRLALSLCICRTLLPASANAEQEGMLDELHVTLRVSH